MALAKRKNQEVEEVETQETTPAISLVENETQEAQPKRRGGPRGPRTKPSMVWTTEKQKALTGALKEIAATGMPVTMGNVLYKLQQHSLFAEDVAAGILDATKVKAQIARIETAFEEKGRPYPFPELVRSKRTVVDVDALLEE